jgi:hypothetical protein
MRKTFNRKVRKERKERLVWLNSTGAKAVNPRFFFKKSGLCVLCDLCG